MDQAQRAYHAIRDGIAAGRYPPGARLVEEAIAEQEGVSRTPVRQALRQLEREGVVEILARRGAAVRPMSRRELSDLYEARARLEAFACELAAERAAEAQLGELGRAADAFEAATRISDDEARLEALRRGNDDFHQRIAEATGNAFLSLVLTAIRDNPLALRSLRSFGREELGRSALFHRMIARAIGERRGDRAARLMIEHVLQARDALVASLPAEEAARSPSASRRRTPGVSGIRRHGIDEEGTR
ncbi:MAG: GntR family transcriptional regulator [Myxococcota bacterium]|jgi:DNA-binding GntR family transcriptional regulator|nr:GntR family transcriptional regulator [Myxococcota bacterium]